MPSEKTPDRTRRWVRVCAHVDKQAEYAKLQSGEGYAEILIEYCREEQAKATAEGFDDTATYLQHVIDDMQSFKQQLKNPPPVVERIRTPPFDCGNGMQGYLTAGILERHGRLWECHADGTMTPASEETYRRLGIVSSTKHV